MPIRERAVGWLRFTWLVCLLAVVFAQTGYAAEKRHSPPTQQVRTQNGQLVERLLLPPAAGNLPAGEAPLPAEVWARRSLDPAWMAELARNPKLFTQFLDAATEPRYMTALATLTADGRNKAQTVDPELLQRLVRDSAGGGLQNWVAAGVDPRFYLTLFSRMASPDKVMRWASCQWTVDMARAGQTALISAEAAGNPAGSWLKLPLPAINPARSTAY